MTNDLAASSILPADTGGLLTLTNLVLIAIGVVLAILVIWWGARLKRQRKAVDEIIEERADEGIAPGPASLDETPPRAPETAAMAEPVAPAPQPVAAPPVTPAPPPLAGDNTPVVATAPYDAAPATIAADLATPDDVATDASSDDLTQMKGVGPKLAARLGELGVTRYAQIAALSPADADALDAQLGTFRGRLTRDRWIEQAGYLARDDRAGFEAAFGRL